VYDLTSKPQALVLLINNHNFENKYGQPEPPRKGSETDVTNVKDTFTKLGCEIFDGGFHDVKQQVYLIYMQLRPYTLLQIAILTKTWNFTGLDDNLSAI